MAELKARWVPCRNCGERIKLYQEDDNVFGRSWWLHQESDDQEPYLPCENQPEVGGRGTLYADPPKQPRMWI